MARPYDLRETGDHFYQQIKIKPSRYGLPFEVKEYEAQEGNEDKRCPIIIRLAAEKEVSGKTFCSEFS